MQVPLKNMAGETVGEVWLQDEIFAVAANEVVMHQALIRQLAGGRRGSASTKGRSEVRGGGRKPWKQKGTGRARHGSIRSPIWRGGGIVHGPKPRSYAQKMPRKMRRLALRSALSVKAAQEQIVVLEVLEMDRPRTQEMVSLLERLSVPSSALVLLSEKNETVERSAANLSDVTTLQASYLNVRDLLGHEHLVISQPALATIETILESQ